MVDAVSTSTIAGHFVQSRATATGPRPAHGRASQLAQSTSANTSPRPDWERRKRNAARTDGVGLFMFPDSDASKLETLTLLGMQSPFNHLSITFRSHFDPRSLRRVDNPT